MEAFLGLFVIGLVWASLVGSYPDRCCLFICSFVLENGWWYFGLAVGFTGIYVQEILNIYLYNDNTTTQWITLNRI